MSNYHVAQKLRVLGICGSVNIREGPNDVQESILRRYQGQINEAMGNGGFHGRLGSSNALQEHRNG